MPRYFFTSEDGDVIKDVEGEELVDEAAAKREAVHLTGSILRDDPEHFLKGGRWRLVVSDKARGDLFTVEVSMAFGAQISDWGHPEAREPQR